jgi:hypothetical protein
VFFIVLKITVELEHVILTILYFTGAENTNSWYVRKGDLQRLFPLNILMVPSCTLIVSTDGEHLMCGGISVDETVHFVSLEFIVDYFIGLSLSPRRNDSGAAFMSSTCSGPPSPLRAMIEDSTEEFYMTSSGEGDSGLPSSRRHGTGTPPAPMATTPWLEDAQATPAMMTVPPRALAPWLDTGLPFEQ